MIDVFITFHKKDSLALPLCLRSISRYLTPKPGRITIVSDDIPGDLLTKYGLNHIHESSVFKGLPRTAMPKICCNGEDRTGWYFQQFLKWGVSRYSGTEDYAVIDADTIFIKPVTLIESGKYVFYRRDNYHRPYFNTYEKLFGYFPEKQLSYIADFMVFNTGIINEIITRIETADNASKWYEIILNTIDRKELSSFSEFETYGYYMSRYHPGLFKSAGYRNKILQKETIPCHIFNTIRCRLGGYTSISYHCYER